MLGPYREQFEIIPEKSRWLRRPDISSSWGFHIAAATFPLLFFAMFFLRDKDNGLRGRMRKIIDVSLWIILWAIGIPSVLCLFNIISLISLMSIAMLIGSIFLIVEMMLSAVLIIQEFSGGELEFDKAYIKHPFVILPSERIFLEKGKGDVTSSNVHPGS